MKRLIDILLSGTLILILLIPGLIVMLVLRLTAEGEVFYKQKRVGLGGEHFDVLKFATMFVGSETKGSGDITVKNDPRVTRFGKFLRAFKINEVPQLLNVLKGDMSLVGWRPLVPRGFSFYSPEVQEKIVTVKPGLTGVGSIFFRDEEEILSKTSKELDACYKEDISPYKGELELWYREHQSIWLDLKVLVCTLLVVIRPKSQIYKKFFPSLPSPPPNSEIVRIKNLGSKND